MSETREEFLAQKDLDNRFDLLWDFDSIELQEFFPDRDSIKKALIEVIIENRWDKVINDEVK